MGNLPPKTPLGKQTCNTEGIKLTQAEQNSKMSSPKTPAGGYVFSKLKKRPDNFKGVGKWSNTRRGTSQAP